MLYNFRSVAGSVNVYDSGAAALAKWKGRDRPRCQVRAVDTHSGCKAWNDREVVREGVQGTKLEGALHWSTVHLRRLSYDSDVSPLHSMLKSWSTFNTGIAHTFKHTHDRSTSPRALDPLLPTVYFSCVQCGSSGTANPCSWHFRACKLFGLLVAKVLQHVGKVTSAVQESG